MKLNFKLYSTNFSAPIKKKVVDFRSYSQSEKWFCTHGNDTTFSIAHFSQVTSCCWPPPSPSLVQLRAHFARHVQCVLSGVLSSTLHMLEKCHFVYNAHISISHVFMHIFVVQKLQINPERESGTDDTYTVYRLYSIHIDSIDNR